MSRVLTLLCLITVCAPLHAASVHGDRVLAVMLEHLYNDLQPSLQQWSDDIAAEGWEPAVVTWPSDRTRTAEGNPDIEPLYQMLQEQEREHDLQGVLLIGRFPGVHSVPGLLPDSATRLDILADPDADG
ncbi:MAG: hypothetical protein ACOCXJ_07305 [Planctomycetota bacterium]